MAVEFPQSSLLLDGCPKSWCWAATPTPLLRGCTGRGGGGGKARKCNAWSEESAISLEATASSAAKGAAVESKQMERKRKQSESNKRHYDKMKATGGQDAWALHREQRAQAAEEARPKQTAEEAELEAKQMERKRKQSESNKRHYDKLNATGGQDAWALHREQRAQAVEEARPKQTAEEAELEEWAFQAAFMASSRAVLALEKQQEVDPLNRYVKTEDDARDMAALVTATLEEQGMMGECIESMNGGSSSHVH